MTDLGFLVVKFVKIIIMSFFKLKLKSQCFPVFWCQILVSNFCFILDFEAYFLLQCWPCDNLCFSWPRSSFCRNWSGTRLTWRRQTFWSTPWHAWHCPRANPTPSESTRTPSSRSAVPVRILRVLKDIKHHKLWQEYEKICTQNFLSECVKIVWLF